jgi:hypothetical protein
MSQLAELFLQYCSTASFGEQFSCKGGMLRIVMLRHMYPCICNHGRAKEMQADC